MAKKLMVPREGASLNHEGQFLSDKFDQNKSDFGEEERPLSLEECEALFNTLAAWNEVLEAEAPEFSQSVQSTEHEELLP